MADLLQSSQTTATQAPSYYTNYLNSIASGGQNAAQGAKFVGAQPLQQKAFANVEQNVGNYQPTLNQATGTLGRASTASPLDAANQYLGNANVDPSQLARQYMNPYTQDVVNSIATLGQRNIQQNLAPQATAAAVGSGQFGSKRGAEVLGQTIQNANTDILAQQNQALQTGYQNAMANAQKQQALQSQLGQIAGNLSATEQANLINAATTGGNLAGQTQTLGLGDVNALATLGGQQQTIGQNEQMFPLTALSKQAELMRGLTIPTSTVSTYKGSPLSAAATIGSTIGGLAQPTYTIGPDGKVVAGPSVGGKVVDALGNVVSDAYDWAKGKLTGSSTSPIDASAGTPNYTNYTGIPTEYDFNNNSNYYTPNPSNSFDFNTNSNYSGRPTKSYEDELDFG
jgi:hypothetical protein